MKIISFTGSISDGDVLFQPDCALTLPGRPVFYPDFGGQWAARFMIAVRVCRLGKCVSGKFASRYYDAVSLAVGIYPEDASAMAPGFLAGMDGTVTHGEWLEPGMPGGEPVVSVAYGPQGAGATERMLDLSAFDRDLLDAAIVRASAHTTLRMGDIVMLPVHAAPLGIGERTRLTASLPDRREILNVKVV